MSHMNGKTLDTDGHNRRREPLIRNSSLWVNSGELDPMATRFPGIADTDVLDTLATGRTECPVCHKSRKYYCYTCYQLMDGLTGRVPRLRLPIKVDIIKHRQEVDGKATSPHAVLIAPDDCTVHTFPDIPDYGANHLMAVLVFPSPDARTLKQFFDDYYSDCNDKQSADGCGSDGQSFNTLPFNRVIFIDSTWRQTHQILRDLRVSPLLEAKRAVILKDRESLFWRHQRDSPRTYLSTIEAIYYFFVDLQHILDQLDGNEGNNDHKYDNLLFFFKHTYNKLRLKYNI